MPNHFLIHVASWHNDIFCITGLCGWWIPPQMVSTWSFAVSLLSAWTICWTNCRVVLIWDVMALMWYHCGDIDLVSCLELQRCHVSLRSCLKLVLVYTWTNTSSWWLFQCILFFEWLRFKCSMKSNETTKRNESKNIIIGQISWQSIRLRPLSHKNWITTSSVMNTLRCSDICISVIVSDWLCLDNSCFCFASKHLCLWTCQVMTAHHAHLLHTADAISKTKLYNPLTASIPFTGALVLHGNCLPTRVCTS